MTIALINFILPLLFIISIATIIYGIVLFLKSGKNESKPQKVKAVKLIILPVVYVIGTLAFSSIKRNTANDRMINSLCGIYKYNTDSLIDERGKFFTSQFTLNKGQTFRYYNNYNRDTSFTGLWKLGDQAQHLIFYDTKGNRLWNVQWKKRHKETILIIIQEGKELSFTKSN